MDDLRWALLGLGLLFMGGLAWWELRKPRHSGRHDDDGFAEPEPTAQRRMEPRFGDRDEAAPPDDELPSMRAVDPGAAPRVMMLGELSGSGAAVNIAIAADVAVDSPGMQPRRDEARREPALSDDTDFPELADGPEVPPFDVPTQAAAAPAVQVSRTPRAAHRGPPEAHWPPEDQRRIVSLRLVPRPPLRFPGRGLRMAFEACGLEFGSFDIFHLVDDSDEVVASAANLMRPGTFAPDSMDTQHYLGVHLFCVLPGPLPAGRAVDELIALARDLAQRLSGIVLDEVGQPLDEERAAEVRAAAERAEQPG